VSEELFRTEALRARWRRAREAVGLAGAVEREDFGIGGLAQRLDAPSVRLLILPADPEAAFLEFDKDLVAWWKDVRTTSALGEDLTWASDLVLTSDALARFYDPGREGWTRYIALHRHGGVEVGLGSDVVWPRAEGKAFALVTLVGRVWTGLDVCRSVVEKWKVPGPWEVSLTLIGTKDAILQNLADGWDEIFQTRTCVDSAAFHRRELREWPEAEACKDVAFLLGDWVEAVWGYQQRQFVSRREGTAGEFDIRRYR
jgi:hypothetical protein